MPGGLPSRFSKGAGTATPPPPQAAPASSAAAPAATPASTVSTSTPPVNATSVASALAGSATAPPAIPVPPPAPAPGTTAGTVAQAQAIPPSSAPSVPPASPATSTGTAGTGSRPSGRRVRSPEEVDRALNTILDRVRRIEDEWPGRIREEIRDAIGPVETRLQMLVGASGDVARVVSELVQLQSDLRVLNTAGGALGQRLDRAEQALGQFGSRQDALAQRVEALERLDLSQELQRIHQELGQLSTMVTAAASVPPATPAAPASPSAAAGPATPFSSFFPGVASSTPSSSSNRRVYVIGGIIMLIGTLIVLALIPGPINRSLSSWGDRESPSAITSSAQLPTEDEGPTAAGTVVSDGTESTGGTELVTDETGGPRAERSQPSTHTEVGSASKPGGSGGTEVVTSTEVKTEDPSVKKSVATPATTSSSGSNSKTFVASSYPGLAPKAHNTYKVKGPDLAIEVGEEIIGGYSDDALGVDWSAIVSSSATGFTLRNVAPGHYHWNVETLSGWRLETEKSQFRLNSQVTINGQPIPVGTGRPHDRTDGANFCITVLP